MSEVQKIRSRPPEVFLRKGVLKICSKFTGEHLIEITLRHGCSPVNLQHIFRIPFHKSTSGRLLLKDTQMIRENTFSKQIRNLNNTSHHAFFATQFKT